jgi:hypothetical protein
MAQQTAQPAQPTSNPWEIASETPAQSSPTSGTSGAGGWEVVSETPAPTSPAPRTPQPTISAAPKTSLATKALWTYGDVLNDPVGAAAHVLDAVTDEIGNYTQEGRAAHPVLSRIGDTLQATRELLLGGQNAGKPMGTSSGVLNNPVTQAMSLAPTGAELTEAAVTKVGDALASVRAAREAKAAEAASEISTRNPFRAKIAAQNAAAQPTAVEIRPESFQYREEPPIPQHGTPVKIAQPLDNATINALPGGRDLSPEGVEALKTHVGGKPGAEIEVGSTPKNTILKAVGPVQKTLAETGTKMNKVIANANPFSTAIVEDDVLDPAMNAIRDNLPGGAEPKLNLAVDKEVESAYDALSAKDPSEVLAYRRKLGTQIDWNNIVQNPETPGEVQNLTKANLYRLLGDKIHTEIPETVPLDKIFQPNLEIQSYLDSRLGRTVSRDPIEANAQQLSEFNKGKAQIATRTYNDVVKKNRTLAGLPTSDVASNIERSGEDLSPIDEALNKSVDELGLPKSDQPFVEQLLKPAVQQRKLPYLNVKGLGIRTNWFDALNEFDSLAPAQRAARFSDPTAVRAAISKQATKQAWWTVAKVGTAAAAAEALGIPRAVFHAVIGE